MGVARAACLAALLVVAGAIAAPASADAARNGLIAFEVIQETETCDQCGPNGESEHVGGGSRVWVVRADGSGLRRLPCTSGRGGCSDGGPAFSHDGRRLAIVGSEGLVVMRVDGTELTRLADFRGWSPSWGPGGRRLAFASAGDSPMGRSVAVTDLTGDAHAVHEHRPYDVAWSRQGRLAWTTSLIEPSHGIWTGDPDGGRPRRISRRGFYASWSPNGSRLAYSGRGAVGVVDADGGRNRLLTRGCGIGYEFAGGVAWSPDGRQIACSSRPHETLVALNLETMTVRRISGRRGFGSGYVGDMAWQRLPGR